MGGVVSYLFFNNSRENIVDPKTGLTLKQMKLMKQTWDEFARPNFIGIGVNAMLRQAEYSSAHPEIKNIFPDFKDIPQCELTNNKKFHAHCQMIMSTVNNAVDAFLANDIELFTAILIMTGERHAKRAMGKLNSRYFEYVKHPLLDALRQYMKSKWTDQVSGLWTNAVTMMIDVIISSIDDYNNKFKW
ncbi:hypothetical protein PV325_004229 [Microctonus aethiopoides]|nr:hypothetical protein PV325_004229 [Microctonus aethiopoides]